MRSSRLFAYGGAVDARRALAGASEEVAHVKLVSSQIVRLAFVAVLVVFGSGCKSGLAQPFDQMKNAPITAYRLQNFEPPPQAAPNSPAGMQIPPQIQQWIQAGAQMLPPGLLPPGLVPGAPSAPAPAENTPRFHEFRVLGWMNIADNRIREEVLNIFGTEDNFVQPRESCMFAEFGFSIAQQNQPPADILVSLSCNQVRTFGFAWPHGAKTGLSSDTSKRIISVMQQTFGG